MNLPSIHSLRSLAIAHSLFNPTTLKDAVNQLKFVQADPIRSPARAQDLILRQRVENYRAGDLEREYPALDLEEDFLYAYGFLSRDVWPLLHPRKNSELTELERKTLDIARELGEIHPRQMDAHFGNDRVVNAWGGYSKATTEALEKLHYHGFLRIARRAQGIRVYEAKTTPASLPVDELLEPVERLKKLILIISNIFAPVTAKCLNEALAYVRRSQAEPPNIKNALAGLIKSGELEKQTIDGIDYLSPPGKLIRREAPRKVRFLAPFDPLVWNRKRFEHFWGWTYRFEAYTPAAKRQRGYYAMPMLWGDNMIGWVNAKVQNGVLNCEPGYVEQKPDDPDFSREFDKEIERLENFLKPVM